MTRRLTTMLGALGLGIALSLAGASSAQAGSGSHVAGHRHQDTRSAGSGHGVSPAERAHHHKARHNHQGGVPGTQPGGNHQHCTSAPKCRPEPLPVPEGGWPCAATHDCASHHHRPICKPPIVAVPVPPVNTPASHVAGHKPPVASSVPMLPRTGGMYAAGLYGGGGMVGLGVLLVMFYLLTSPERARVRAQGTR